MRKIFLILFLFFLICFNGFSQLVPNGNFENWSFVDGVEEPDEWESNNTNGYLAISKTNDSYSGNNAMQVTSTAWGLEGYSSGRAWITYVTPLIGGFSAYVKCDSISGSGKGMIHIIGYDGGVSIPLQIWETLVEIPQYTLVEIPLDNDNYDSIRIRVEAFTGNNSVGSPTGYSSIKVDSIQEISFDGIAEEIAQNIIRVYPNPVTNELIISSKIQNSDLLFFVYDDKGCLIHQGLSDIEKIIIKTQTWETGKYILKLKNASNGKTLAEHFFIKVE